MTLGAIVDEAIRLWRSMRDRGLSKAEADCALEATIRETWVKPHGRTEPWRYLCELCNDTGARVFVCRRGQRCNGISTRTDSPHDKPGKYRRLCAMHADSDYEHDYIEPCVCQKGDRFRDKPKGPSDFTDAGKTKAPPRKFSRFGEQP